MNKAHPFASLAILLLAALAVAAPPPLSVNVGSRGSIDSIRLGSRDIVKAGPSFVGGTISLAAAGDGTAASLFAGPVSEILTARVDQVTSAPDGTSFRVRGTYVGARHQVPFTQSLTIDPARGMIDVQTETDFSKLDPSVVVASQELRLSLVIGTNEHERMFGFGGTGRAELFRMDMNDISRVRAQSISAPRGHWPAWDLGGVLYVGDSYTIWKANHADTPAYPLEQGTNGPGWADYSERDGGLTVVVPDPVHSAPWSAVIDVRAGVLTISPVPASQMPAGGRELGVRRFRFQLLPHDGSWPATVPCELPVATYEALLAKIPDPLLLAGVGTADRAAILRRERLQPSVILRLLYRGDAWRMADLMKSIGRPCPRNQPWDKWEAAAQLYLAALRTNGMPAAVNK